MSNIRRQTIISSLLIYVGFAFGALNTYLFTKHGIFTPEQYGLTRAFIVIGQFFYGFAGFGLTAVIYKFYPYYKDNLPEHKNDLLTLALMGAFIGFIITITGAIIFEPLVVRKFIDKSPLIVKYYYWIFPFTFFLLFFSILEAYAWTLHKTIIPNFLKEAGFRISTTLLIILFIVTGKNFELFIRMFSLIYAISFFALLVYIVRMKKLNIVMEVSRVTKKFKKKIFTLIGFVYGGSLISTTAQSVDIAAIASFRGLNYAAVFDFGSYIANVIQVPLRSMISISVPVLSRAWKDKDFAAIKRIYTRSSINLLLIALFIFSMIWLNYDDAIHALNLNPIYEEGKWVVFFLGLKNIIDMGTGVNGQIIGTSTYWRFDFLSGMVLLLLAVPLNIILVKEYGIIGSAWSNLGAYIIYNGIRILFLWRKFRMQPFTIKTIVAILHAIICFTICYYLFRNTHYWQGIILRSSTFLILYLPSAYLLNLSPDIKPLIGTIKKRFLRE
ncbi:MAG TPA: polysaccharide biosynthesis C-terminal domain-containing protein [Chitinophagaceae bacterium]|jgi:Membrane protein involved in the export of O-antigen and teichoic acid